MKFAVVGTGIVGVSTAYHLAKAGHQVTVFEQYPVGHKQGSSHGRSRIVRRAYPRPFYTRIMTEAYPMWHELDSALGGGILHECGLLYIAPDDENLQVMLGGLDSQNVRYELRDSGSPLNLLENEVAVFIYEGGWVHAERAVLGTLVLAKNLGVEVIQKKATPEDLKGFDAAVVAAGSWVREWVRDLPVKPTKQTFAYVKSPHSGGPVWITESELGIYGFPPEPNSDTLKLGVHRPGAPIDPSQSEREPSQEDLDLLKEFIQVRFGIEPEFVETCACLYTNAPNEDFIWGKLDDLETPTFYVSACSGHAFKFGPWLGKKMASFALGEKMPEFLNL